MFHEPALVAGLEIAVALTFFLNKILFLLGKKSGWAVGAAAALMAIAYFGLLGLVVFTTLEIGLVILFAYGLLRNARNQKMEGMIRLAVGVVMSILAYLAWQGLMTAVEWISATLMLGGTYLFLRGHNRWAWGTYVLSHAMAAWMGLGKDQEFFAIFQIASSLVSVIGLVLNIDPSAAPAPPESEKIIGPTKRSRTEPTSVTKSLRVPSAFLGAKC